ncbi:MAG: hypothetical protein MMC33_009437 [Icmadophila ericetorum]|nr:hypothetical protein [Icmadophila ericetorum]
MASAAPTHLNPSELGKKEHWDEAYARDYSNLLAGDTDSAEASWFQEVNAEAKVATYLTSSGLDLDSQRTSFLDIGMGNGSMCTSLVENGFCGKMVGVDYSEESVKLARTLREGKEGMGGVEFVQWDVMKEEPGPWLPEEGFTVVLDKGTFDAISLSEEVDAAGRRVCEGYRERVEKLVAKGGLFLVTSCNWTEEELERWFTDGDLDVYGKIKYPTFKFGGQTGQSISSLCFRKRP